METYITHGTCSVKIDYSVQDGIVTHIHFERGCAGNTAGISRLAEGLPVKEVVRRLKGIRCGLRGTSCPDQLATAMEEYLKKNEYEGDKTENTAP
jgi:uncharacterized protein (TIGR03905 family)